MHCAGDLGDITLYQTKRGKIVAFPRIKPDKPASPAQKTQRYRFAQAMASWHNLTSAERAAYDLATHRLSICMTGLNLWIHFSLKWDAGVFATVESQSRLRLPLPDRF